MRAITFYPAPHESSLQDFLVIACDRPLDYFYDRFCSIWALGITAIELAQGERPLSNLLPMRVLFMILCAVNSRLSTPTVEADLGNSWESFHQDHDKFELAKQLEAECAGSVLSLWQHRQRAPEKSDFSVLESPPADDATHPMDTSSPSSGVRSPPVFSIPPPPNSPPPTPPRHKHKALLNGHSNGHSKGDNPTENGHVNGEVKDGLISPPSASKVKFSLKPAIIPDPLSTNKDQKQTNGATPFPMETGPKFDFRTHLRKTNIDLSHDDISAHVHQETGEIRQYDFRHVLKKTGRRQKIIEQI